MTTKTAPIAVPLHAHGPQVLPQVRFAILRQFTYRKLGALLFGVGGVGLCLVLGCGASFVPDYFEPNMPAFAGMTAGFLTGLGLVLASGRYSLQLWLAAVLIVPVGATASYFVGQEQETGWIISDNYLYFPPYRALGQDKRFLERALIPALYPSYGPLGIGAPLRIECEYTEDSLFLFGHVHIDRRIASLSRPLARYAHSCLHLHGLVWPGIEDRYTEARLAVAELCSDVALIYGPAAAARFANRAAQIAVDPAWRDAYFAESIVRELRQERTK